MNLSGLTIVYRPMDQFMIDKVYYYDGNGLIFREKNNAVRTEIEFPYSNDYSQWRFGYYGEDDQLFGKKFNLSKEDKKDLKAWNELAVKTALCLSHLNNELGLSLDEFSEPHQILFEKKGKDYIVVVPPNHGELISVGIQYETVKSKIFTKVQSDFLSLIKDIIVQISK